MAVSRRGVALTRPLLHPRARVLAAAITCMAIGAAACLAPPATSASPPTPVQAAGTGATPVVELGGAPRRPASRIG